ncbi:MAG: DUF5683 domain-containing protein [Nonlabens sp.]
MRNRFIILLLVIGGSMVAQGDPQPPIPKQDFKDLIVDADTVKVVYDANKPSRAAFYSAVLPGLGQIYNKQYWKLPIVYGGLGGLTAAYIYNDRQYNSIRDAFKIRLAGGTDDEFSREDGTPIISTEGLERAQQNAQRNKELSILLTALMYVVQVVDANVAGHLDQFDTSRDLSFSPYMDYSPSALTAPSYGLSISYRF